MGIVEVNFNTKHLTIGDPLPPWNGKLRVYNMRLCPFAQRTILALNAKQLDYEVINIDLTDKPEWLTSKSAFGKVPALEIEEGVCIYESLVTVEYLEDAFPQRPLFPQDPVKKAFDKIIVEASGPILTLYFKVMRFPDTINDETISAYAKALAFIQDQLRDRGTTFLDGSEPGYADYMLWPWFERIRKLDDEAVKIDPSKFSLLLEYIENMAKDPAVSVYLLPDRILEIFHRDYKTGTFKVQSIED
ncbi:pyrimidodiazepine synthase isoform X2 [Manduca sexta]|uniref:Uncharacterized protein n=1 Tax=Manduca sexta TaxID=7130 RepID=A0A921YSG9_MANSE|nr:pyrimidodiazepine synthase isoform X2 [Manduca sexta]KAG6444793.1 hypothetical protein O3G_MSEX003572 [Manduca sexta]KAG6444794.1 hypothetical protein O3G_MSEX003572 [Manduca sexta]